MSRLLASAIRPRGDRTFRAIMDNELMSVVLRHAQKGNAILFGRSATGGLKIKVKHGPFNVLTSRYKTNPTTFEAIRAAVARQSMVRS